MTTSTEWDRLLLPNLAGKVALVTGAASGMGASIASALAHVGADVALVDVNADGLESVREQIVSAEGRRAVAITADLARPEAAEEVVRKAVEELGGLNVLVSAAGIFLTHAIEEFPVEDYDKIFNINARAAFLLTKAARAHLSSGDSVILISSGTSDMPSPYGTAYAASKGAIISLTRALSAELAPEGIRVNSVSPGFTDTKMMSDVLAIDGMRETIKAMTPNRRVGEPEDVAAAVVFLASDGAVQVIGANLAVDGGITKTAPTPPARTDV